MNRLLENVDYRAKVSKQAWKIYQSLVIAISEEQNTESC